MKKQYLIACFLVASNIAVQAQTAWDLRKCIEHALTHNLSIKQKEASRDQSAVELNTAQWKRLPNLNGNIGQSFNYGRAIQADNTYGNRNTRNTNFSIGTSIPLFTGMQIPNNIALSRLNLKAAIEDLNKAKEDISIQVTSYYLQALFNEELVKVAQNQVSLSKEQLERKVVFFKNGKASESEVYEAQSRLAQDEYSLIQAQNNHHLSLLDLSQLLELPSPENFQIVDPEVEAFSVELSSPDEVYSLAVQNKPAIKAAQYRLEGATKSIRIAQSGWYPQLTFGAGIGTNYYSITGIENAGFGNQWRENMNKYLQFSLSIPLFNRFETRNRVKSARIQRNALAWQLEETKKNLYKEIQQAYYNALAAESQFQSSEVASKAAENSFKLMSEKYANGKANATEYNEMRANWMKALSEQLQARYDYLFRSKILEFYKGIQLDL